MMTRNTTPTPSEAGDQYECRDCLARVCSKTRLVTCPECGSEMANLSKPRE